MDKLSVESLFAERLQKIYFVIMGISGLLTSLGAFCWYFKVQKPLDKKMELELELLRYSAKEARDKNNPPTEKNQEE